MDLKKQVCSLELAKELKELGVEQESLWYWCYHQAINFSESDQYWEVESSCIGYIKEECCSAFTVAELGELLPDGCEVWCEYGKDWYVSSGETPEPLHCIKADTEANAKAKLLIWYLTEGANDDNVKTDITECDMPDDVTCFGDCDECGEVDDVCTDEVAGLLDSQNRLYYDYEGVPERLVDSVNHPDHYTSGGIETIDFIEAKQLGFHLGNAVKYIARAGKKDPDMLIQDLEKARWYLDRAIENDGDAK